MLVTEVAESCAGDEVILSIAGHTPQVILKRYSHIRREAKRRALAEIVARQNAADEKRQQEVTRMEQAALVPQTTVSPESPRLLSRASWSRRAWYDCPAGGRDGTARSQRHR